MKCKYHNCKNDVQSKKEFCSESCGNKYRVKKRQRSIKNLAVEAKGGKCCICGYNQCTSALEFHHVDRSTKLFSISTALSKSWPIVKYELGKCVLLCANCHRGIESGEIEYKFTPENLMVRNTDEDKKYKSLTREEISTIPSFKPSSQLNTANKVRVKCKNGTIEIKKILAPYNDEEILAIIIEKIDSIPIKTLAKSLQISIKTFRSICKQNNIKIKRHHKTPSHPKYRIDWVDDSTLKELVWQIPISRLASAWGITDNSIIKRCRKRGIPMPGRGYWRKKECGKI